jgi:hypothetical protein
MRITNQGVTVGDALRKAKLGSPLSLFKRSVDEGGFKGVVSKQTDISKPSRAFCKDVNEISNPYKVFGTPVMVGNEVEPIANAIAKKKRSILNSGPIVVTIRLTAEFLENTNFYFNPTDYHFCALRAAKCERTPETKAASARPSGMSLEEYQDTWYNHFVVLHGWGKLANSGDDFWVIENSWGPIYQYPSAGVASAFLGSTRAFLPENNKSNFLIILDRDAGKDRLEMTTRPGFAARDFVTSYSKTSRV